LGAAAAQLLPLEDLDGDGPLQIDLVLGAAELWVFPFEACLDNGRPVFADRNRELILTRRIRQGFVAQQRPWPATPRVLFLHAPSAADLSEELIDQHRRALADALLPWSPSEDPIADNLLDVQQLISASDIGAALQAPAAPFTHVHVLAHGKKTGRSHIGADEWGLRLGNKQREATPPSDLAEQFALATSLPTVVTLAVCDAGNIGDSALPKESFAQELHKRGVPVVLAPQLPLTQKGSVTLAETFYQKALEGVDVRRALHETRLALFDDDDAAHDWISLTGYVQLPEGYGDYLAEVGVKRDMERLKVARRMLLGQLMSDSDEVTEPGLNKVETELLGRLNSLRSRFQLIPNPPERRDARSEFHGVLASAEKRLAEFHHLVAQRPDIAGTDVNGRLARARSALRDSYESYKKASATTRHRHWLGVQTLNLEAVLHGSARQDIWQVTRLSAELEAATEAHLAGRNGAYWPHGTLAEVWLLAPLAGIPADLEAAKAALTRLVEEAAAAHANGDSDAAYAAATTRDQLRRYVDWWTNDNGYFPGATDLSQQAEELLEHLAQAEKMNRSTTQ